MTTLSNGPLKTTRQIKALGRRILNLPRPTPRIMDAASLCLNRAEMVLARPELQQRLLDDLQSWKAERT